MIDIYPPSEDTERRRVYEGRKKDKKRERRWVLLAGILLLFFAGYLYYSHYGTRVIIHPSTASIEEEREVLVRGSGSLGNEEIRGVMLSEEVKSSQEFPVEETEMIKERAEGRIEVCQEYSESAVPFREGTRFVSDEGKLFEAVDEFTLPSIHENQGCEWVEVVAAEPGEEYNIGEDPDFALPGLEGTAIYGSVKGRSFELHKEGREEEVPYLGEETMQKAEEEMKEDLLERGREMIESEYAEDYLLTSDEQFTTEIVEKDFQEKEDEDVFDFTLLVRTKALAIDKQSVKDLIYNFLPEDHTWRKGEEEISFEVKEIDFDKKEGKILLYFAGEIYEEMNRERIKREIIGIDTEKAEEILGEMLEVEKIEVKPFPFGLGRVVEEPERVEVRLKFDKN